MAYLLEIIQNIISSLHPTQKAVQEVQAILVHTQFLEGWVQGDTVIIQWVVHARNLMAADRLLHCGHLETSATLTPVHVLNILPYPGHICIFYFYI